MPERKKDPAAVALGKKGGARRAALSHEERVAIAQRGRAKFNETIAIRGAASRVSDQETPANQGERE